jgi:5S rRNA maturation endonuclease (ribonuclease M5)
MSRLNNTKDGEKLSELINTMRDDIAVVEGRKDKEALYCLGLRNIIAINGKPPVGVANDIKDALAEKEGGSVVILTDFDREGRKLAAKLRVLLQRLKIHPDARLRRMFMSFGKTNVESLTPQMFSNAEHKIEDFGAGVPALSRGDYHVKISSDINEIFNKGTNKSKGGRGEA